ncbi:MAG: M67 family metallopeptidase [Pseudomonadota bacterium]
MLIRISSKSIAAIRAHAAETPDEEVCGLLFGTVEAVEAVQRCKNVASTPATRFEIDPAALIAAHKAERAGGAKLIGHYHSHPNGVCAPSEADRAEAGDAEQYWLIMAGAEMGVWHVEVPHQFVECGIDAGSG